ncbi:sodium:calcium antiporter [Acetohalobium arabaticum]|uniref:Sodium/calcium exchanger membrane region n=1 Tax=Acetohalobium arabaticum (strain ATCC 49924 / DSM 5501 / Z-7288) TaxID=574087 RepID=D9QU29_ACEAZ|nr:sodium:calcium antiporter [Acetohalobium arabaticum]ADL13750.1 sodium/calcium exchanger membrane region [Acetohalobium arabaticum DSM 5501]
MLKLWLIFLLAAVFIIIAGTKLSKYGDIIAIKTGLGQALVGSILMAGATSLPEVMTSSTAAIIGAPNIAIGNVFGSNTFNLMVLALVDLVHGSGPFMLKVHSKHILSALLGILLSVFATLFILVGYLSELNIEFLGIGLGPVLIVAVYLIGTRLIFRYEKKNNVEEEEEELLDLDISLNKAVLAFTIAAVVIIISGIYLSSTADKIAELSGLDESFMGTILVAAATSLPEMVAALAAIRINAYDMAVGNVFGSNIFNMVIISIIDLSYREGSVLAAVSLSHAVTAVLGVILSSIAVIGLFYRSKKTFITIGWDSVAISITYLFGAYLLFRLGVNF